jgi:hypothetical protein
LSAARKKITDYEALLSAKNVQIIKQAEEVAELRAQLASLNIQ